MAGEQIVCRRAGSEVCDGLRSYYSHGGRGDGQGRPSWQSWRAPARSGKHFQSRARRSSRLTGAERNSGRCCTQTVAVGPNVAESSDGEVAIRMKSTEDLCMRGLKVQEKTQLGWAEKSNG